ncbi:MAG: FAD-binding oxidoreductase [Alphaproteobacteria bacterium]
MATAKRTLTNAFGELAALFGERFSTGQAVRDHHARGPTHYPPHPPDAVVFARSTEEVAKIVGICARERIPMVPFGVGSSLEGQVNAVEGGVTIDLSQMDRIVRVSTDDLDCTVEAGVTRKQLNTYLRDTGLFYPVDPGADASIGGMAATRASGTNAVRYGTLRETVLGLTVVTAEGKIVHTGGRARKSAAGYDLTRLFVGSEGTLGVITEVTLRLFGLPEEIAAAACSFPSLEAAVRTVILTIQSGIPVARIELLDEVQVDACNRYSKLDLPVAPTIFFEFHGTQRGVDEQVEQVGAIAKEYGASDFRWAKRPEDRTALWQARHDAYFACVALKPGSRGWATDVCVPISALAECLLETKADIDKAGLTAPIVGHVGDGNFHVCFTVDPDDEIEMGKAKGVNERMIRRALTLGGTCTGEHGIGFAKLAYMEAEHGDAVSLMRAIKHALDPHNLMNPGKVVPPA